MINLISFNINLDSKIWTVSKAELIQIHQMIAFQSGISGLHHGFTQIDQSSDKP